MAWTRSFETRGYPIDLGRYEMTFVEKVTPAMFDDVFPLLSELEDTHSREEWREIFDYQWESDEGYVGYALVDDRKVVGFNGALFSRRIIDGREARICNLTSWIVKEQYRTESMRLVFPFLKLKGYTITNLTMNERAWEITKRLGYKNLDTNIRILFPVPGLSAAGKEEAPVIVSDQSKIAEILDPINLKIFMDHSHYNCGHLVIQDKYGYSYIIYTRKRYRKYNCDIPYAQILYISDRSAFLRRINKIKSYFLKSRKYFFLAVDERLIGNAPIPYSKVYQLKVPRMYKSDVLSREQIDNLYTELVVLGL
jgi:RimJ/RimL family protein N-acetyltransferase